MNVDGGLGLLGVGCVIAGCVLGGVGSGLLFVVATVALVVWVWRHQDGPGDNSGGGPAGFFGSGDSGGHGDHGGGFHSGGFGGGDGGGHGGH